MRSCVVVLAFAVTLLPAQGQDYDDPAIAVCEQELLVQRPPIGTYERISGVIDGSTVQVRYTDTVLNIRPEERQFSCRFALEGDKFQMVLQLSPDFEACADIDKTKLDSCGAALKEERLIAERRIRVFTRLKEAGIIPIDAAETRLKQQ